MKDGWKRKSMWFIVMDWNVIYFVGHIYSNVVVCTKLGVLAVGNAPNWHENAFYIFIDAHVSRS